MKIIFERHNPNYAFGFDKLLLEAEVADDPAVIQDEFANMVNVADAMFPASPQMIDTPQVPQILQAPAAPVAQPQQAPAYQPQPAQNPSLAAAEATISPCGESKGLPLSACQDNDLEYLATKYKKDGNIKQNASIVLAARRMGQTAIHY